MRIDAAYCSNSFLRYRCIADTGCGFSAQYPPRFYPQQRPRTAVGTARELEMALRRGVEEALRGGKVGLMLSGGMDSAILARMVPPGTAAYTLRCQAEGAMDEWAQAHRYAGECRLDHRAVEVTWADYEEHALPLMQRKGCPIHPLEVQIYKAALQARADGLDTLLLGETADIIYGGHSRLLSRDWTAAEFMARFTFVEPELVLRHPMDIPEPVLPHVGADGRVDVFAFLNEFEYTASLGFYENACAHAGIGMAVPYAATVLAGAPDLERIRRGESKYLVRELFGRLYPGWAQPEKTPLPRPMEQWLQHWAGPSHPSLRREHILQLTGEQKWYVYALDQFLRGIGE